MDRTWSSRLIGFLLISLAWASSSPAGDAFREDFESGDFGRVAVQRDGVDTQGFTLDWEGYSRKGAIPLARTVDLQGLDRGAISFDLQRRADADAAQRKTVFTLLDGGERAPFFAQVVWSSNVDPSLPMLYMNGQPLITQGIDLWQHRIVFDQPVAEGQWIHVDITWDDVDGRYGVYVDGRQQDVTTHYNPRGEVTTDMRPGFLTEQLAQGGEPTFARKGFAEIVGGATELYLGVHYEPQEMDTAYSPLSNSVLDNFAIIATEPLVELHTPAHDVTNLGGALNPSGVALAWAPPALHGVNQQYVVYRRLGDEGTARFEKIATVRDLNYTDTTTVAGETYRYSVASVYGDLQGGTLEGKYPPEITVAGSDQFVTSVSAEQSLYGAGQEIVVTLRGTADLAARFTIAGVAADVAMEEIDDGVYVGRVVVPDGANLADTPLTATVSELTLSGGTLTIDTMAPEAIAAGRILDPAAGPGEIELSWAASASTDVGSYAIYRSEGDAPVSTASAPYDTTTELNYLDTAVLGGLQYHYIVVAVDAAGNPSGPSDIVTATAVAGDGPSVSGITLEPFGRPARPGTVLTLTLTGQSGAVAILDLGTLQTGIALTEAGRTGVYTGTYTVTDAQVAATKTSHRLVAHLSDAFGATDQAGPELAIVGRDALNDHTPPVISSAGHDGFQVAGFSGKLVAGDLLTVTLEGEPYGYASFAIDGVTGGVEMAETPADSGVYTGTYTVDWDDAGSAALLTATLADEAGNATTTEVGQSLAFDTRVRLSVTARDTLLPADRESQTRLVVKAEDANGGKVSGHELSLMLSTTEEYTGVVGGGDVEGRKASKDDVDDLEVKWGGTTDFGGEVAATYTAGFAAKTALIVVKDLTTGDVGAGWLNTYVASTVAITLTPVSPRALRGTADQAVLTLTADSAWLTADGRSKSRLTATLRDLSGNPIEGARISFALAGDNGILKILDSRTNARGVAEAEYRAGTLIGTVMVTAASTDYGVTAAVQITLMSDAPAKIDLVASAVSLSADGSSTATLAMRVTDFHDNPNSEVPVTLAILAGTGDLSASDLLTDRNGEGAAIYTAGSRAGTTVIEARHTSRAPTQEELQRIYGTVFVPRLIDRQERERIKVTEWLAEPGDEVLKGQPLVVLGMREASWTINAPATGIFVREVRHRRDRVELGDTLGYVEIDTEIWTEEFAE